MRKKVLVISVLFLVLFLLAGCELFQKKDASANDEDANKPTYKLYLSVDLVSNANYPYDVAVFLDDKEVGTVPDGKSMSVVIDVKEGSHELRINKLGKKSIKVKKAIEIKGDTSFSCEVKHKKSSMEMFNLSTKEGLSDNALVYESVEGLIFGRAVRKLELIGFTNIKENPQIEAGKENAYIVVSESIAEGDILDKNDPVQLECMEVNAYLDMYYKGLTIKEVQDMAEQSELSIKFVNNSDNDMDETVIFMDDEEKTLWRVIGAKQVSSSIIQLKVSDGTIEAKDDSQTEETADKEETTSE